MRESFIPTGNYSKLVEAIQELQELPASAPKLGLGYGSFGLGKSFGLEKIASDTGAILLRARQVRTKNSLLGDLCYELGLDTTGVAANKQKRVEELLIKEPTMIIVDEVDTLIPSAKFEILEVFRELHDEAKTIIFFVGMEESNRKLKMHRHFYSRIVKFVEFDDLSRVDIEKYCELSDVKIEADLVTYFTNRCPNLRKIKVLLIAIEKYAMLNDFDAMTLQLFKSSGVEND
jgi:DNA transposition AAA+ family ATPase